jgi:hypothetical protein
MDGGGRTWERPRHDRTTRSTMQAIHFTKRQATPAGQAVAEHQSFNIYIPHPNFVEALKELQLAACIKRRSLSRTWRSEYYNGFDFLVWRDAKNGQRYTDHSRKGLFFWLWKVAKDKVRAGMTLSRSKSTKGDKDSNEIKSAVDRPKVRNQ